MKTELRLINGLLDAFCRTFENQKLSTEECLAAMFSFVKGIETICANLHVLEGTWDLVQVRDAATAIFHEILQRAVKAEGRE